jgi:hypothetical protein
MTNDDAFLPPDYEVPKRPGKYLKFADGKSTRFRILSQTPVMGNVGWDESGERPRPVRKPSEATWKHGEVREDKISHFWLLAVWNYDAGRIQVLELTQSTIQEPIKDFAADADYGHPTGYDIVVKRVTKAKKVTYTVTPKPRKPLDAEVASAWDEIQDRFDLTRMFSGGDPFGDDIANGDGTRTAADDDSDLSF